MGRLRRLVRLLVPFSFLAFASCEGHHGCPGTQDMRPADLLVPRDLACAPDLSALADLASAPDLSSVPDLSCTRCNPVINPCPALGLYCWPVTGCCDSTPHLGGTP